MPSFSWILVRWPTLRRGLTIYFLKKLGSDDGKIQGYMQDSSLFWALHIQWLEAILSSVACEAQG
jgi:hypothetical protein